jgi:prophage regulatory protein
MRKQIVRPKEAAEMLGVSLSTIWRYLRLDPDFPKQYKLSTRVTGFDEQELNDFCAKKRGGMTRAEAIDECRRLVSLHGIDL